LQVWLAIPPSRKRHVRVFSLSEQTELFWRFLRTEEQEAVMRSYLAKLTPQVLALLAVPVMAIIYSVAMIVVPALYRAVVPDAVRAVLQLI
jgi:hypothetical protein